jgi:hypothetical protein
MTCSRDENNPSFDTHQAELQDTGLYYLECPRGHRTVTCLQEQKFEVLFDMGANAIVDSYYREAITAFSASLERFFEFFIAVVCAAHGIQANTFAQTWKTLGSQSERQLGGFVIAYLIEYGEEPLLLRKKTVEFRNSVVHKGIIPSREKAIEFGSEVLALINPTLRRLKEGLPEFVSTVVGRHIQKTRSNIVGDQKIQFLSISTTVSIARANSAPDQTLDQTLELLTFQRKRGRHYQ